MAELRLLRFVLVPWSRNLVGLKPGKCGDPDDLPVMSYPTRRGSSYVKLHQMLLCPFLSMCQA